MKVTHKYYKEVKFILSDHHLVDPTPSSGHEQFPGLPTPTSGGQIVIVLHSRLGPPTAPSLLVKQVLFLTEIPSEASLHSDSSKNSISSRTLMLPVIVNVLDLYAALAHSLAAALQAQHSVLHAKNSAVSGTVATAKAVDTAPASAIACKFEPSPTPPSINSQSHQERSGTGSPIPGRSTPLQPPLHEPLFGLAF